MRKTVQVALCLLSFCVCFAEKQSIPHTDLMGEDKYLVGIWAAPAENAGQVLLTNSGKPLFQGFGTGSLSRVYGKKLFRTFDANGFDEDGIHRDTGTRYDPNGYDVNGYDRDGFNAEGWNAAGINKETGTIYDVNGYDINGWDAAGFSILIGEKNGIPRDGCRILQCHHKSLVVFLVHTPGILSWIKTEIFMFLHILTIELFLFIHLQDSF